MKKTILYPVIILLILSSCSGFNNKEKISELQTQLDSASRSLTERDSVLTGYLDFVNTIEKNLNEIRNRESMISLNREDFDASSKEVRENMINDLKKINDLMQDNKRKIAVLSVNLRGSRTQVKKLKDLLEELKQTMQEKESEVQKLNQQVAVLTNNNQLLKMSNDSLLSDNQSQNEMINDQKETIKNLGNQTSTAYYATGPAQELEKKNIIEKNGGILGIGAVEQLNDNLTLDKLQNIDTRNTFSIPINSRKAQLITYHPRDSYKMVKNDKDNKVDKLLILDPHKFWASSKCLVVVTK